MKKFRLFWQDGKTEIVEGETLSKAFTAAGYGSDAIAALDFYTDGEEQNYTWDSMINIWVKNPNP